MWPFTSLTSDIGYVWLQQWQVTMCHRMSWGCRLQGTGRFHLLTIKQKSVYIHNTQINAIPGYTASTSEWKTPVIVEFWHSAKWMSLIWAMTLYFYTLYLLCRHESSIDLPISLSIYILYINTQYMRVYLSIYIYIDIYTVFFFSLLKAITISVC